VHVRVDQTGQQHAARCVDDLGPGRIGADPAVVDDDGTARDQLPSIEHADVRQDDLPSVRRACG
jgi:hypothetical protein